MADVIYCQLENSIYLGEQLKCCALQYSYQTIALNADEIQLKPYQIIFANRSLGINTAWQAFSPVREHEGCAPRSTLETHKADSNRNRIPRHPPPDTHRGR